MGIRKGYTVGRTMARRHGAEHFHKAYERLIHQNLIIPVQSGFDNIRPHPHSLAIVTGTSDGCFFIRREPFLRSFQFDDAVYMLGHKPSQLTAYLNPSRFYTERDSTELNFSFPSTLQRPDTSLKLSMSYSNTLTSLDATFIPDDDTLSTVSSDKTHIAPDGETIEDGSCMAPPCTRDPSIKSVKPSYTSFTPVVRASTMATTPVIREKQTGALASSLRVYCIPPPPPHSRTRSITCPTRRQRSYLLNTLNSHTRRQEQPLQESFDEVSLLLGDQSDNSSWINCDAHVDDSLNIINKDIIDIETHSNLDLRYRNSCALRCSQISAPNPRLPDAPCTVRDFGIREYSRRRVIQSATRKPIKHDNHKPESISSVTSIHKNRFISPLTARPLSPSKSKPNATPAVLYEHLPRNMLPAHDSIVMPAESAQQRFPVKQANFIDRVPTTSIMNDLLADSKQVSSLHMEENKVKQSPSHQKPVNSSLDKSISIATLFASLPDMGYSRSNLSQQERIARIFGPQTINKERTRTIKDIMMVEQAENSHSPNFTSNTHSPTAKFDALSMVTETEPPLPPDAPSSLIYSRKKRLTYSLSNMAQQRSQMAAYTHFETRTSSSPLQTNDLSVDSIYKILQHDKSQHTQRTQHEQSLKLESPFRNLHQPSRSIDKILSPFTFPRQASCTVGAPAEQTLQNYEVNLTASSLSQIDISANHSSRFAPSRFVQCIDFSHLSKEVTSLVETVESLDDVSSSSQVRRKNELPMFSVHVLTPSVGTNEQSRSNSSTYNTKIGLELNYETSTGVSTSVSINTGGKDVLASSRQSPKKTTQIDIRPRSLIAARRSVKQPPRVAREQTRPLLPSEISSDSISLGALLEDNAIMITDTSDITQVFPSSDYLSDSQIGYGIIAEFHSPEKNNPGIIPQTPRNETVRLDLARIGEESTDKSNQLNNSKEKDEKETKIRDSLNRLLAPPRSSIISTPTLSTESSRAHSAKRSTFSILPSAAALESIRNSNYASYGATDLNGHIYFRSSTPTQQNNTPPGQYIMHPERRRLRSTLASSKKTSDPDRTSAWSSRTSDMSMSYADYKSALKGTGTVPRLPRYLRYNEFYTERMAEYGRAPIDASEIDYTGSSHQHRLGSESDDHSSLADLSWNTQYYLVDPSSHRKTIEDVYRLASMRPNNVLKKFLEEKRIMTRRRARFKFDIVCIVAKVQVQTAPDGTTSKRVVFDVC